MIEKKWVRKLTSFVSHIIRKFIPDFYLYKYLLVRKTRGISEADLNNYGYEYYLDTVKPNLINETLSLINRLKDYGYEIIIASAGSKYYIQYFAEEFEIDGLVTATIGIRNGLSTGKLVDDCMGQGKVEALKQDIGRSSFDVAVSDSISDMPIFLLGKKKIVISKNHHQSWVRDGMEEIIWE